MENYFWLIDNATTPSGVMDEIKIEASTKEEAIRQANIAWSRLTLREQKKRDAFYICYAPEIEEDVPDLDRAEIVHDFKEV